jgi:hypothetical protein
MDVRWQRANKRHHDQHGWKDQDMSDTIESLKLRNEELEQHNSRLFEKERDTLRALKTKDGWLCFLVFVVLPIAFAI